MSLESFNTSPEPTRKSSETELLAQGFRELSETHEQAVFKTLEKDLFEAGFTLAPHPEVVQTFNNASLLCRSESFSHVMDLIIEGSPLTVRDTGDANMCIIASGSGFRVAMQEGFSGKDVDRMVKVVLTFKPDHLRSRNPIARTNELWNTKPETAQVSLSGGGEVFLEDVSMVSFRFPIRYFPTDLLTESEKDLLEEDAIGFVVRHYNVSKERTIQ